VVIQKTYSPDMPGEFGGGAVRLRTKSYPDGFVFDISGSLGANTETTFRTRPTHRGGSLDWLGLDDGSRAFPEGIPRDTRIKVSDRFSEGYSDEERAEFARLIPNNWNVYASTVPVDRGLNLSVGDKYTIGSVPIGFVLTGVYDDSYQYEEERQYWFSHSEVSEGELQPTSDYTVRNLERTVSSGTIFNIGSEYLPGQSLKATTLLLKISRITTQIRDGLSDDLGAETYRPRLQFVEQQLLTQQVSGEQKIPPLNNAELDWRYAYSQAFRDEPFRREFFYYNDVEEDGSDDNIDWVLSTRPGTSIKWAEMDEEMHDVGFDYTQPFPLWDELEAKVKAGAAFLFRDREFQALRFTLSDPTARGGISFAELRTDPESVFSSDNINGERGWTLSDNTQPSDEYTADQKITAGYGMLVVPLIKPLELTAGARVERSRQKVHTFNPFDPEEAQDSDLDNTDVLPAGTIAWRMTDEMVLRFGYGRTVSRPDLRELSPSPYRDLKKNMVFAGNPELKRATIDNFDTRWEWYFSTDEFLSIGGFYKVFTDPIEQVIESGQELSATWNNAKGATNLGIELEARRRLEMIHDALANFYLSLNVAWIDSNVDLGEEALASTSLERPLQGQSPFVINTQIGFDDSVDGGSGITAALLYNVFGRRIDSAGRLGLPDIYEEPFHQLDLAYGHRLGYGFSLKFRAKNILDLEQKYKQGVRIHKRYKRGRSFSVGLSWRY
jgi:outer membrane receptor protein involved in Fe transport